MKKPNKKWRIEGSTWHSHSAPAGRMREVAAPRLHVREPRPRSHSRAQCIGTQISWQWRHVVSKGIAAIRRRTEAKACIGKMPCCCCLIHTERWVPTIRRDWNSSSPLERKGKRELRNLIPATSDKKYPRRSRSASGFTVAQYSLANSGLWPLSTVPRGKSRPS